MARKYDSTRRAETANQTREAILASAFKLHGENNDDIDALAALANVSVATVRKHFPTREALFQGCTTWGLHQVPMPDLDTLSAIQDPEARLREAASAVCAFHETVFGQMWMPFILERESSTLAGVIEQLSGYLGAVADIILRGREDIANPEVARGSIVGLLHPLAYRALRKYGGLSPEAAMSQITMAISNAITATRKEAAHS